MLQNVVKKNKEERTVWIIPTLSLSPLEVNVKTTAETDRKVEPHFLTNFTLHARTPDRLNQNRVGVCLFITSRYLVGIIGLSQAVRHMLLHVVNTTTRKRDWCTSVSRDEKKLQEKGQIYKIQHYDINYKRKYMPTIITIIQKYYNYENHYFINRT